MWTLLIGIFMKWFGSPESIINGAINAYMKAKDVDLEKFKSSTQTAGVAVASILEANIKFANTKAAYATGILQWLPFRIILLALIGIPSLHFCLIVIDSMCPAVWDLKIIRGVSVGSCGWGIPSIPASVFDIYQQMLLFFIIAKPVDTAVSGLVGLIGKYLNRK